MDAELKDKWVKALRSGEYKQTTGVLRANYDGGGFGYCCLGVLLDVQGAEWETCKSLGNAYRARIFDKDLAPNSDAGRFADAFPEFTKEQALLLMNKNDGCHDERKHSFSEIADHIEAKL